MTAHYPKLGIPTASVTVTLLDSCSHWKIRDIKQQAIDPRSYEPHRPLPRLRLNRRSIAPFLQRMEAYHPSAMERVVVSDAPPIEAKKALSQTSAFTNFHIVLIRDS